MRALLRNQPVVGAFGQKVYPDVGAGLPVRRHLQDRRPRQTLVREKRRLAKLRTAAARHHVGRDAGQRLEQRLVLAERQRHQRRPRRDDGKTERARQLVGEPGGADLGNAGTAGGDDQRRRNGARLAERNAERPVGVRHLADGVAKAQLHVSLRALIAQHRHDLPSRAVAEQLPQRLFVPGDAVAIDQSDEVLRPVAAQGRLGEMRVLRQEAFGRGVQVGKVAAAAAGDEDLLAGLVGVVDQQDRASTLTRHGRTHHPCSPGTEDDGIELAGCGFAQRNLQRWRMAAPSASPPRRLPIASGRRPCETALSSFANSVKGRLSAAEPVAHA